MDINFSAYSIRKPVPAVLTFVVLMLAGWVSFMGLSVTRFPNIDIPVIAVRITQSGSTPAELETQVTKKVEDSVAGITGVKHINSTLTDGSSVTAIEFRLEVNTDRALNDVKDAVAKIRGDLPRTIDEPIIDRIDIEGQAIQTYAASSPGMTLEGLSFHVDDVVKRNLQGLKGVGQVERYGGVDREIRIALDPDRLLSMGVTAADVNRVLRASNLDAGAGRGEIGGLEQSIRTLAGARSVEALGEMKIPLAGGRDVRLRDLGTVSDSFTEPRTFARLNGQPVVSFSIFRAKGASDYSISLLVKDKLEQLQKQNPDVSFALIDDGVAYTYGNYTSSMSSLVEGAVLAVIVVFIFLRNWRATLITAMALPLSAIPTFWAISMLGFSLNLVSLLAITLATGILVDDAIVEIENIARHMHMGKSPYKASMEAADEIGLAVIAITFTIVAVFAPVSFMGGVAGQYFKQFGLVVAAAVLFSLLVARLITPMLSAYFMRPMPPEKNPGQDGWVMRKYLSLLDWTLKHRYVTLVAGIAVFVLSILATSLLPTGFIPPIDQARSVLAVELPPGSTLEDTRITTEKMRMVLTQLPEVRSVFVLGGTTPTGTREIRRAAFTILLTPKNTRKLKQKQIEAKITEIMGQVPDMRSWYVNERGDREMAVSILAPDGESLNKGIASIEAALRRQSGFTNVAADAALERPEIRIRPRAAVAAEVGITSEAIAEAVRVATIGDSGPNLARYNTGDRLIPIRVQLEESARADLRQIEALRLMNATGQAVPLSAVAEVSFGQGPSSITRYDRTRRSVLGADLIGGLTLGQGLDRLKALPEAKTLPEGVRIQETGDAEIMGEVFSGFIMAMGFGLIMVFVLLILLFGSVFQPMTILLSLPLSIGGVIIALVITGNPISMPVVIGILMLIGIVTKNAILLVDFAVEEVARGVPRFEAIVDAGRKRARPIIMTTIAMAAGMVPSAIGLGMGGEFRAPMAIGVIGGLLVSTLLSLIFVPSFYTVSDDLGHLMRRVFGRFLGPNEDAEAEAKARAESIKAGTIQVKAAH